jgi:hypothetical protein
VLPVLSPDNNMQVVPDLLASASRSIAIEQPVTRNREASLPVDYRPLARYYQAIFDLDWATGLPAPGSAPPAAGRAATAAMPTGPSVPRRLSDYLEI